MKAFSGAVAILFIACAPTVGNKDSGPTDSGTADVDLSTTYSCGGGVITCMPNEYCVHPCCMTQCAGSSGGLCPFGTHIDASCPDGCRNDTCMPPPLRCGGNTDPCFGVSRTGRDVFCYCG